MSVKEVGASQSSSWSIDPKEAIYYLKAEKIEQAKKDRFGWHHVAYASAREHVFFWGDVTTLGSIFFGALEKSSTALAASPAIHGLSAGFGAISGLINAAVGLFAIKEALQSFANSDYATGCRLLFTGCCLSFLGIILFLSSVFPHTMLGSFLIDNPWLLPVLFAAASLPSFAETAIRVNEARKKTSLGEELRNIDKGKILDKLEEFAQRQLPKAEWEKVEAAKNDNPHLYYSYLMETAQANVGAEAAVSLFAYLTGVKGDNQEFQNHLDEWNRVQKIRLTQRTIYFAAFVFGMMALGLSSLGLSLVSSGLMASANGIAAMLDGQSRYLFIRNVCHVVPRVRQEDKESDEDFQERIRQARDAAISSNQLPENVRE